MEVTLAFEGCLGSTVTLVVHYASLRRAAYPCAFFRTPALPLLRSSLRSCQHVYWPADFRAEDLGEGGYGRLRTLRVARGMSQRALALAVTISVSSLQVQKTC